jgi:hypothetical protein
VCCELCKAGIVCPSHTVHIVGGDKWQIHPIYGYNFLFSISIDIRNCSCIEQENQDMH